MTELRAIIALIALLLVAAPARAEMRIGVAAPLSGPSALLGAQVRAGAEAAASMGRQVALSVEDDACTAQGGARAARALVAAKVQVAIGFLCTEAIEAALPLLKAANIPTVAVGVRTDSLTDRRRKSGWLVWRIAPRADAERDAVASLLTRQWAARLFAIVDDGTIYGRELAESFRLAAEQAGLKPVFVDTFRPGSENQIALAGRLGKAGATHVLVGGDADDIAILGRDAASLGVALTIAGGESLRAAPGDVPLSPGTLMVALPEASSTDEAVTAALAQRKVAAEGYVLPAYAALEIARAALDAANGPALAFAGKEFATALGPIRFDDKGDLAQNPYRLFRFDGARFVPADAAP